MGNEEVPPCFRSICCTKRPVLIIRIEIRAPTQVKCLDRKQLSITSRWSVSYGHVLKSSPP